MIDKVVSEVGWDCYLHGFGKQRRHKRGNGYKSRVNVTMIMRTALNVLFDAGNDFEPEMVYEREYKKEI